MYWECRIWGSPHQGHGTTYCIFRFHFLPSAIFSSSMGGKFRRIGISSRTHQALIPLNGLCGSQLASFLSWLIGFSRFTSSASSVGIGWIPISLSAEGLNNMLILDSRHWRIIQRRGTLARLGFAARGRVELSEPPPTSISRYFCEVRYPYYESENTLVTSMMTGKPDLLHICATPPIIWSELDTMFIECKCMPKGLHDWIFGGVRKRAGNNAANTRNRVPGKRVTSTYCMLHAYDGRTIHLRRRLLPHARKCAWSHERFPKNLCQFF